MDEEELKEKLEKLEEYEAKERRKKKWRPYVELQTQLRHMHECLRRLENAAIYQGEADEISDEFHLDLTTYGRADIWDAHADLESQIEAKEEESERMGIALEEEEE